MKLTGGEIVAHYLIKEKVPYALGIPGHGCLALVDALMKNKDRIKTIQVRQEMSAVHMADGYFRACGRPLACFTSIGPGAINTAIGLATCYVDSTAALVLTGDVHTYMFGKGVLQEIERRRDADFPQILEPVTKRRWQVTDIRQLPSVMQRAFSTMLTGRRGPVLISLPMDVQADSADVTIPGPASHEAIARPLGDPKLIEQAASMLARAERPVIVAGGGVNSSEAWQELTSVAQASGAAVVTTFNAKGCFPEDHPQSAWISGAKGTDVGNRVTRSADVVLAVGCRFADESTSSYRNGISYSIPPTRLIQIDIEAGEIGKNYPVEVGIVGDAKAVLAQITHALKAEKVKDRPHYLAEIASRRAAWFESLAEFRDPARVPVTISRVLAEVREFLDRDALVVSSSGNAQAQILQEFAFYEPRTNITTGGFSTMGFTLPAAMGAKLARPGRQVIGIAGDGDFLMTVQELATAVQYEIPVVMLVLNNYAWMSISDLQMAVYGEDRAFAVEFRKPDGGLVGPDFEALAKAFGCYAEKVDRAEQIKPALRRAFESGRPAVIEAIVNREFPYSGGKAVGWWDVPVPMYLEERRAKYEKERSEEVL